MSYSTDSTHEQVPIRAVTYARTAVADRQSLDEQRAACEQYADKQGYTVIAHHEDDGASGLGTDRPGLQALLRDLEDGRADIVLVAKIEALARSAAAYAEIWDRIRASGARIVTLH